MNLCAEGAEGPVRDCQVTVRGTGVVREEKQLDENDPLNSLKGTLLDIYGRKTPPEAALYVQKLMKVNFTLLNEDDAVRPCDGSGLPGGIVQLKNNLPTVIVPDLHARMDFFLSVMSHTLGNGRSVMQMLGSEDIQVVCVGDGFHAEGRAVERWHRAFLEFNSDYKKHRYIDEEMMESLGLMEMVFELKTAFSDNFHFLKGNHENIANEEGFGNHPFRKFAFEGHMVARWVQKFYGKDFIDSYYEFEKNLPLFVIGRKFVISHAEPLHFFEREAIVEYRNNPDVVEGLTWTANDEAEPESVSQMLRYYLELGEEEQCYYFGGHRPVTGLYNLRAEGKYVQIHNPGKFIIVLINPEGSIDLDEDIFEIESVATSARQADFNFQEGKGDA
jgi:hypothetical protein